jgi:hypothetical protein
MPVQPFGLCGPTFSTRNPVNNAESCRNWYPNIDASGDAKSKVCLRPVPGLSTFATVTGAGSPPIRGLWSGDQRLFAVSGGEVFEFSSSGVATKQGDVLSAVTPVQFAGTGESLLIASGDSVWRVTGGTGTKVYDGAISVVWLDGYAVILLKGVAPDFDEANFMRSSQLGSDGAIFDGADTQHMTGPADRGTQLRVHEGNLWVFGSRTIQVWFHSGAEGFPFEPVKGASLDVGTDYPWTIAEVDRKMYFLGFDGTGKGRVYRTEGYTPIPVSNEAIEYLIDTYMRAGFDQMLTGYGYEEDGHTFYVLSFPKAKACLVYDLVTNMWHERARWDGTQWQQWRGAGYHATAFGRHFVARATEAPFLLGDERTIYEQDITFGADAGLDIRRQRTAPWIPAEQQWLFHHYLRLYTDATTPVSLRYQKDDGTWSNTQAVTPFKHEAKYRRLGRGRDRYYEVTVTDKNRPMITEAWLHASTGLQR